MKRKRLISRLHYVKSGTHKEEGEAIKDSQGEVDGYAESEEEMERERRKEGGIKNERRLRSE